MWIGGRWVRRVGRLRVSGELLFLFVVRCQVAWSRRTVVCATDADLAHTRLTLAVSSHPSSNTRQASGTSWRKSGGSVQRGTGHHGGCHGDDGAEIAAIGELCASRRITTGQAIPSSRVPPSFQVLVEWTCMEQTWSLHDTSVQVACSLTLRQCHGTCNGNSEVWL